MHTNYTPQKLIRITTVPMALRYLLPGQMKFMQENGFEVLMISADGKELNDVIANENCRHTIVPMTRQITPLQDLKCLLQLIKIFKKEKPDIVHSHTPKAGLLGMLAAKICGIKTRVHTVAGLPMMVEKGAKFHLLKLVEKITYASANFVWPNSDSLLQYISHNKLTSPQKLNIIARGSTNGINTERFDADKLNLQRLESIKKGIGHSAKNTYLLCMGRLVKDKGIIELVNVFSSIQQSSPLLRLILVGDFEEGLDPLPAATISEIKSNNGIIHIPWTSEVEYYMHLADTFIFPSHREGFPNVLMQAGAMKLPIVCSRITGNVDIVHHNETGLLFNTGNEQQMRSVILQALGHKEKMLQMAARLRDIICTDYHRTNIWKKILQQYSIAVAYSPTPKTSWNTMLKGIAEGRRNFIFTLQHLLYGFEDKNFSEKST